MISGTRPRLLVSSEFRIVAQTSIEYGLHPLATSNSTTLTRLLTKLQWQLTFKDIPRCLELQSVRRSGLKGLGMGFKWFKHLQSVTHTTVHFPNLMRPQVGLWAEMFSQTVCLHLIRLRRLFSLKMLVNTTQVAQDSRCHGPSQPHGGGP